MIKYRLMNWVFNSGAWASAMRDVIEGGNEDVVAELMEVHVHTIKAWAKMKSGYEEYPYPNMTNFIKFCNTADYDPREFYMLEDK